MAIFLLASGCQKQPANNPPVNNPIACNQEAKQCSDGSYVARSGPNCEFAECPSATSTPEPVICPQLARLCPDGSYVHPSGPKCEFPACPKPTRSGSGLVGSVLLGPTCPVERIPPDSGCAPKAYQATIVVKTSDGQKEITRFTTDSGGKFKVSLDPGDYLLVPQNGNSYPIGRPQQVTVTANNFTQVTISFDTGIR